MSTFGWTGAGKADTPVSPTSKPSGLKPPMEVVSRSAFHDITNSPAVNRSSKPTSISVGKGSAFRLSKGLKSGELDSPATKKNEVAFLSDASFEGVENFPVHMVKEAGSSNNVKQNLTLLKKKMGRKSTKRSRGGVEQRSSTSSSPSSSSGASTAFPRPSIPISFELDRLGAISPVQDVFQMTSPNQTAFLQQNSSLNTVAPSLLRPLVRSISVLLTTLFISAHKIVNWLFIS